MAFIGVLGFMFGVLVILAIIAGIIHGLFTGIKIFIDK